MVRRKLATLGGPPASLQAILDLSSHLPHQTASPPIPTAGQVQGFAGAFALAGAGVGGFGDEAGRVAGRGGVQHL